MIAEISESLLLDRVVGAKRVEIEHLALPRLYVERRLRKYKTRDGQTARKHKIENKVVYMSIKAHHEGQSQAGHCP
jgi:hypothetical protein